MKWDMKVVHAGVYRDAQKGSQATDYFYVGFVYSGLKYLGLEGQEGVREGPVLTLRPPGVVAEFEFGANRENWVLIVETKDVRPSAKEGRVEIRCDEAWVDVPWYLPVEPSQATWWQTYFMQIYDLMQSPTLTNVLLAELRMAHVMEQFLVPATQACSSAEQRLKSLIDHDPQAHRTLKTLAQQCGYSADHLRVLFEARYGLTPIAYRQRRRMTQAMSHITRSDKSVKQISLALGFTQVAHFSAAFRQTYAMTPSEAVARFRQY